MTRILIPLLVVLAGLSLTSSAASDPNAVLKAFIDNQRGGTIRATIELTVTRPDRETKYVLEIVSDGQERSLSRVKAPARDAGQAFLRIGDNIQIYNPTLKRTLRLPPSGRSDSFLGSDLSYSDLTGRDLEQDYSPKISVEDDASLTLELTPKPQAPTPYGKVTIKVRSRGYAPLEVVFFDQRAQAVKKISFAEYTDVSGHSFPVRTTVEDLLRQGSRTTLVYKDYKFGATIPESCFTQRALEAGC